MADTKRLLMLKALTTHLETEVSIANGYNNDLAGKVFRGRMYYSEKMPLPSVSILDALNPDRFPRKAGEQDKAASASQHEGYVLLVQGWVEDDELNPTDPAHVLMGDVKKALAKINKGGHPLRPLDQHAAYLLGGLVTRIDIEPGTVRPPDELSAKAFFWLRVAVGFAEDLNDPFSTTA
jgi:hypothetical protein